MSRTTCAIALALLVALPAAAQQSTPKEVIAQQELDNLTQAQATQLVSQFTSSVDQVIDGSGACGPVTFGPGPGAGR